MAYPSAAFSGIGTIFKREGTAIAEVLNVAGPNKSRATIGVTNFDSQGGYEEFIGGLRNGGSFTFSFNFTKAGYGLMDNDFESDTKRTYSLVLPDSGNTEISITGLVVSLGMGVELNDVVKADCEIKISGATTVTS